MKRAEFVTIVLAATALPVAAQEPAGIPATLRGGRFFATPRTVDGRTFRCWLDTDGGGFIFGDAVRSFKLRVEGKSAALPAFASGATVPVPARNGGLLPVFERDAAQRSDPILQDFEAQLGATWFAGRIWRLDFPAGTIRILSAPLSEHDTTAPVELTRGVYPRTAIRVDGETLRASFDIAASLATAMDAESVRATSFVKSSTFDGWHSAHPEWKTGTVSGGIRTIIVPEVRLGEAAFTSVEFSTRPNDDVFEGDDVDVKIGANAYANAVVTLDYTTARLAIAQSGMPA